MTAMSGHAGVVGLHHRGVELHGGRPAGRDHHGGPAGAQPETEGDEAGRPLVEHDVEAEAAVGGQGQGQRGRARAGGDHRVAKPGPGPLVDQGGGEGGLGAGTSGHGRVAPCSTPSGWVEAAR